MLLGHGAESWLGVVSSRASRLKDVNVVDFRVSPMEAVTEVDIRVSHLKDALEVDFRVSRLVAVSEVDFRVSRFKEVNEAAISFQARFQEVARHRSSPENAFFHRAVLVVEDAASIFQRSAASRLGTRIGPPPRDIGREEAGRSRRNRFGLPVPLLRGREKSPDQAVPGFPPRKPRSPSATRPSEQATASAA